ncbi:hypothetical protein BDK51DRAFT_37585, partial [Blyttiomyces helicus]
TLAPSIPDTSALSSKDFARAVGLVIIPDDDDDAEATTTPQLRTTQSCGAVPARHARPRLDLSLFEPLSSSRSPPPGTAPPLTHAPAPGPFMRSSAPKVIQVTSRGRFTVTREERDAYRARSHRRTVSEAGAAEVVDAVPPPRVLARRGSRFEVVKEGEAWASNGTLRSVDSGVSV